MSDPDTSHPFACSRGSKASKGSRASKGSKDSRDSRASLTSGRSGLRVRDASDGTVRSTSSVKLGGGGGGGDDAGGGGGVGDGERPRCQSAVSESDFSIDQDNGPDAERSAISLLLGGE